MIQQTAWDALYEDTQSKLRIAADANLLWSLSFTERRATEAFEQFKEAGTEISRLDDAALEEIQKLANETMEEVACENPLSAKVYASQITYLHEYASWRNASAPFNLGRDPNGPDLEKIQACAQ